MATNSGVASLPLDPGLPLQPNRVQENFSFVVLQSPNDVTQKMPMPESSRKLRIIPATIVRLFFSCLRPLAVFRSRGSNKMKHFVNWSFASSNNLHFQTKANWKTFYVKMILIFHIKDFELSLGLKKKEEVTLLFLAWKRFFQRSWKRWGFLTKD